MKAATLLLSGGLDSAVLLHHMAQDLGILKIHALSFRYGQKHSRELEMADRQATKLSQVAEHRIVDASFFGTLVATATALVKGGRDIPDLDSLAGPELDQPPTYVPNRNMVLLAVAAAFAEARDCDTVFYGAQAQDRYGYWDCTPEFVQRMNDLLALNRKSRIQVSAPFASKSKTEVVLLGAGLGVDFTETWSCYRGGERPCGKCPTCAERKKAFSEAGIRDPLEAN